MSFRQALADQLRRSARRVPGLPVLAAAVRNYILHQSANQAGSVAFSAVLAMFPLLILVSAAAAFVGEPQEATALAGRALSYTPKVVGDALRPVVDQVLRQRNQALLAIGVFITLWTASSGTQAIRTALNKAYGVERGLSFWQARIKVIVFTVILATGTLAAFSSVVVMPHVWQILQNVLGAASESAWLRDGVRYGAAFLVLTVVYALMYGWLPDIPQRLRTVLPGALVGAALWAALAAMLSYTLRSAGELVLVYGGFAGLVATLVFLYLTAVTLIFGGEVNAVLRARLRAKDAQ